MRYIHVKFFYDELIDIISLQKLKVNCIPPVDIDSHIAGRWSRICVMMVHYGLILLVVLAFQLISRSLETASMLDDNFVYSIFWSSVQFIFACSSLGRDLVGITIVHVDTGKEISWKVLPHRLSNS